MRHQLGDVGELHTDRDTLLSELLRIAYGLSVVMLPIFGLMMLGGAAGQRFSGRAAVGSRTARARFQPHQSARRTGADFFA